MAVATRKFEPAMDKHELRVKVRLEVFQTLLAQQQAKPADAAAAAIVVARAFMADYLDDAVDTLRVWDEALVTRDSKGRFTSNAHFQTKE